MRGALVMVIALAGSAARAAVPLCVEVHADSDEPAFQKLVADELRHHPTHQVVSEGCRSRLVVELFTVAGVRYLTARVDREVPVRFAVKSAHEVDDKLSEALRQVLQHDPVYLSEDLSHMNAVMRAGANVARNGSNRYRVELVEVIGSGGRNAVFASGAAVEVARGIDHVQVLARLEAAGAPHSLGDAVSLRVLAGAEVGCMWEASARANPTFYIGAGVALHYVRFEDSSGAPPANTVLFSVAVRTGFRFLRYYGFDVDLFGQVHLPLYKSYDPDSTVIDAYTPYAIAGLGVGF